MDFDIGNLFYIVITLVAVIIGLLGKKKKPAEGGSGTPGSENRPGFMENLERMLTMDQEQAKIQDLPDFEADIPAEEFSPEVIMEEKQPELLHGPNLMEEYDRIMKHSADMDADRILEEEGIVSDALEVIDLDELQGTDYFEIVRDFDAGTAVVYSAIINRLDY